MKVKPVRICDISRMLRISSASLISFLREKGYSVIGEFRSPLSSRMVELIQNGYHEGPPFQELNPLLAQAENWETQNTVLVEKLHTAPPSPKPEPPPKEPKVSHKRPPRVSFQMRRTPLAPVYTGRISLTFLDLELIQRALELPEPQKIIVRDQLRRRTLLQAISQME